MSAPLQFGHVGLNVSDLARALRFYTDVLGLRVLHESDDKTRRYAYLGAGSDPLVTLWEQSSGPADHARPGLHHLAFVLPAAPDLERLHEHLRRLRVPTRHDGIVSHHAGGTSAALFFDDPDGNRLEVYVEDAAATHPTPTDGPACGFF